MQSFWEFLNESDYYVHLVDDMEPKNDIEQSIYDKRFNIKKNYDLFVNDITSTKIRKGKKFQLFNVTRRNEGIFSENIARNIFKGENLNHFTKNHPYVDIAVIEPIDGITKENELISVKSTLEFKSIANLLRDTKAIKFESLMTFLIYAYTLNKHINLPFSFPELARNIKGWLKGKEKEEGELTQTQYKGAIYILLENIIEFAHNPHNDFKKFEEDILTSINDYIDKKFDISETVKFVINEISSLNDKFPVSLSVVFIGKDPQNKDVDNYFGDIDPINILNIYKTKSIPLGEFFLKVMRRWAKRNFFGAINPKQGNLVTKYLSYGDIANVFGSSTKELFPNRIYINLENFKGKTQIGNERKRLYVATQLKNGYFDEYEDEVLDMFQKMIKQLEKDPSKIKKFKEFL